MPAVAVPVNSTNVRNRIVAQRRQLGLALWLGWQRLRVAAASAVSAGRAIDVAARIFPTPARVEDTPRRPALFATGTPLTGHAAWDRIAACRLGKPRPT